MEVNENGEGAASEQEEKYQETGQFPAAIQDQEQKDYCGWFSKGKPRGDACADFVTLQ